MFFKTDDVILTSNYIFNDFANLDYLDNFTSLK